MRNQACITRLCGIIKVDTNLVMPRLTYKLQHGDALAITPSVDQQDTHMIPPIQMHPRPNDGIPPLPYPPMQQTLAEIYVLTSSSEQQPDVVRATESERMNDVVKNVAMLPL